VMSAFLDIQRHRTSRCATLDYLCCSFLPGPISVLLLTEQAARLTARLAVGFGSPAAQGNNTTSSCCLRYTISWCTARKWSSTYLRGAQSLMQAAVVHNDHQPACCNMRGTKDSPTTKP